ncbi:MAG: formylglycine-generating enzyme family protein [Myxococcales bacterium]|nr:formylglycine-generating enzyme family protein [Myxococcales bacterium]MCB9896831.1 formylglycine-generating enzyme family protein [Planctomycetota bacterium]
MRRPSAPTALLVLLALFACVSDADGPRSSLGPAPGGTSSPSAPTSVPGGSPADGQGASANPAPPPSADLAALHVEHGALAWGAAPATSGGRRRALLVGADRYRDEPLLDLGKVSPLLSDLRDTLLDERLGFDRVSLVTGDRVHPDIVQDEIASLTADLSGPDNHLLVLWVGHGFNDGSGRETLLTYRSRAETTSSDPSALPYDQLVGWIAQARTRVDDAGGELTTSMLLDACRQDSLGSPGRIRDHVPVLDVEAFSAPLGSPAPGGATTEPLWTRALQRALAGARSAKVSLLRALENARAEVLRQSGGRVEPEIPTGAHDVTLVDHDDIALTVRVVDRFTQAEIAGAQVRLNALERTAPATFTGLARSPEGYALMVRADGYFWRAETIPLDRAQAGGTLTVPLAPEFVALSGSVRLEGTGVARVAVTGGFPGLRDGWHVTSTVVDGSGAFLLKVPAVTGERALVIDVNGEEARRRTFDMSTMPSSVVDVDGTRVRVLEFGASVVSARGAVEVGGGTQAVVVGDLIDVRFDFDSLGSSDFTDRNGFSFYGTVHVFSDQGAYGKARRDLDTLLAQGRVVPDARARAEELRHELRVADAMSTASDLQETGRLDEAIEQLDVPGLVEDGRVRSVLVSWLLASARGHHAERRYGDAAARLERARELDPAQPGLDDQLARVHDEWIGHFYEQALGDGSWDNVSALVTVLAGKGVPGVQSWRERIEREDITPACRRAYTAALEQLGAGALEDALASFETALASGCNEQYRSQITPQLAALRNQLFDRHVKAGAEREAAGALSDALAEYVAAHALDRVVTDRIASLLAAPELPHDTTIDELAGRFRAQEDDWEGRRTERLLALGDLRDYARLDATGVDAVRRAAEQRWPDVFAHLAFLRVERFACGSNAFAVAIYRHPPTGLEFVLLPGGTFLRGSGPDEPARRDHESSPTSTTVTPFLAARTEVTRAQWRAVMGDDPSWFSEAPLDAPVESITPTRAREFCARSGFELPTEFRWEFACRAGSTTPLPSGPITVRGDNDSPEVDALAWFGGNSGVDYPGGSDSSSWVAQIHPHAFAGTHAVAGKAPNAFGLYDVLGNVWELCSNTWEGDIGVSRGGSWSSIAGDCRAASRNAVQPDEAARTVGFRPVIELPGEIDTAAARTRLIQNLLELDESDSDDVSGDGKGVYESLELDDGSGKGAEGDGGKSGGLLSGKIDADVWRWMADQNGLFDRARYAELDLEGVERVRRLAERRWPAAFTDLELSEVRWESGGDASHFVAVYTQPSSGLEFVLVPGGTYEMGSQPGSPGHSSDEGPAHEVTIAPMLVARTEVTQGQWTRAMGSNPSYFGGLGDDRPVEHVSWDDAHGFCDRFDLSLPTEAEWEYLCRAGTTTPTPWGGITQLGDRDSDALDPVAVYGGNSGVDDPGGLDSSGWTGVAHPSARAATHPVASKQANAFGLYDVLGNVYEWCEDVYRGDYSDAPGDGGPVLGDDPDKVVRGGDFSSTVSNCRSTARGRIEKDTQTCYVGFRPVRRLGTR